MVGRRDPAAFRPSAQARQSLAPSRRQAVALIAVLVLVASAIALASYLVKPSKARAFDLFYGSIFLNDERAPVSVDLTNGKPTVRLVDASNQVSAKNPSDLVVTPLVGGTLLLDAATGEFNMLDASGFVIKTTGGGVQLPQGGGQTTSVAFPSGGSAYIEQTGAAGTSVFLVGQTTVQSATGAGAKVRPRASTTMTEPGSTTPGAAASANGDLWLLVGPTGGRTIRQLSVPRGSDAGATLGTHDHGTVSGAAAVGVAARRPNGSGGDVVAVASAGSVQLFEPDGKSHDAAVHGLTGVDEILAASNSSGSLSFLYHSSAGWSVVTATADDGQLSGPKPVAAIAPTTHLAAPGASAGRLYTMDVGSTGELWQIAGNGAASRLTDAASYPVVTDSAGHALEPADFSDAYVVARSKRVVFDSPHHLDALALFTDGSRGPAVIDKGAAVSMNAAGNAASLTDPHAKGPKVPPKPGQNPTPQPAQPINNELRCRTIKQVPHVPTITQATPGSRSVQLQWTYPLLDTQDCAPSTYRVSVKVLSAEAPSAPSSVTVQGQDGVNLTGLFPSTQYEITVTAFINGSGTPSVPVQITTGPEGPAAPTNVQVRTDSSGDWTVTWNSCGGIRQGCVPSSSWSVIPQLCDNLPGLSSAPATISVAGDPTQHTFTAKYPGTDDLLGHGLSFHVIGIGEQGAVGTPGRSGDCAYSWGTPISSAITVVPSVPSGKTHHGDTTTVTVTLRLGSDPVRAVGGVGAKFTYQLLQGNRSVATKGPTDATSVTFPGIVPGLTYEAQVLVEPPRHPEAAITVGPVPVQNAISDWPPLSVGAEFTNTNAFEGSLTVHIDGLSSADANGELFDLVNSSLTCESVSQPLERSGIDPSRPLVFDGINRSRYNGDCTVQIQLQEGGTGPLVFGGSPSPAASGAVAIPVPSLTASAADFRAAWSADTSRGNPQVIVSYDNADPLLLLFATSWSMVLSNDGGTTTCGTSNSKPTATIPVSKDCVKAGGTFTVAISFTYFGSAHNFTVTVGGIAPQPIDPTKIHFAAAWDGLDSLGHPQVGITSSADAPYNDSTLAALNWTEAITSDQAAGTCGSDTQTPTTTSAIDVAVDDTKCPTTATGGGTPPPQPTFTAAITYTDPATGDTHTYTVTVTGTPPS